MHFTWFYMRNFVKRDTGTDYFVIIVKIWKYFVIVQPFSIDDFVLDLIAWKRFSIY